MRKLAFFALLTMCVVCGPLVGAEEKLAYVDLVKRLTDLERLSVLPAPGEQCMQWSSYDRASRYDEKTGKYLAWGANGDGTGCIRREGDNIVMAEMEGPGCIWRIWSALAGDGRVRIYLDGAAAPAVDLPFKQYFNRKAKPFAYPSLVHMTARGLNNYVPIPFQKSCRIVAEPKWGRYYHFTYALFPKGTQVPTFKMDLSAQEEAALKAADDFLSNNLGTDPAGERQGQTTGKKTVAAEAGKSREVLELTGPKAITCLKARMDFKDREDEMAALRELVLQITWDSGPSPAVWAPLGDFFGSAPGVNKYKSLPLGMADEGFYCFWYMPFARSAKIELVNGGKTAREVAFEITHAPLSRPIEQLGRFHVKWHRDAFNPQTPDRAPDWTMLKTDGRGRYCGVNLHVWNPKGGWWGEGDEKFFVDAEKFPSTIGTGSEDYFGYAWCNPTLFQNCYHNQTISQGNRGHVSVNRWHVTDNVPFQKSFEGAIEKYYPNRRPTLYAAIAYWYLAAGAEDAYPALPVDQRWGYCQTPPVFKIKGAIEGEKMKVLARTGGVAQRQDLTQFGSSKWSRDAHLWWIRAKPGDKLTLALPVEQAGKYELRMQMTKAIDYGIHQLSLDAHELGEPIDLFNNGVIPTKEISFGVHELSKGVHKLQVEVIGANAKAVKAYMFGLDYVLLKPAE